MPPTAGHVVPASTVSTSRWLHSVPLLMQGAKKEKLLPPLLPFCLQHGLLRAAKQVKFIESHAKMAAAVRHRTAFDHTVLAVRLLPPLASAMWVRLPGCSWCQDGPPSSMAPMATLGRSQWPLLLPLGEAEEELSSLFSFLLCRHRGVADFPDYPVNVSII